MFSKILSSSFYFGSTNCGFSSNFKEALRWLVFFGGGKVFQYKSFLFSKFFFLRLLFWLYALRLYMQFSPKKRRCYLFMEALKWLFSFLEMVRFCNINHFLCSKIFSWGFGFGSTHGDVTRDYHVKNKNLKTWIIHE